MKRCCAILICCILVFSILPCFASASSALSTDPLSSQYRVHTVKKGDCLISIGRQFGVPWLDIAAANGIKGPRYVIITGDTLKIPPCPKLTGNTGNYLILCETEAQKQCLSEFLALKTWFGYTMTVKSVEADVHAAPHTDAFETIQQYLKTMDQELSLEYVLLIGNPYRTKFQSPQNTGGIIPMRYLYYNPTNHNTRYNRDWYDYDNSGNSGFNTPTDLCYALDFNWDYDKDGYPGEIDEIQNAVKESKPTQLFLLGRIPFSDATDIQTVLDSTVQYELNQRNHSNALIGSYGAWTCYGNALAKNLAGVKIETVTVFGSDSSLPSEYKSTYPFKGTFPKEAQKKYDFTYTIDDISRYQIRPDSGSGISTGFYFMDSFATMQVETEGQISIQNFLSRGMVSAAIATTREVGFNPDNPAPRMASLLFSNHTPKVAREFYSAELSMLESDNVPDAYVYCYLGDPSLDLKP